jgi:hypothetical protein
VSLDPGCGRRRFASGITAEKAVGKGAAGTPEECRRGGRLHWHLKPAAPVPVAGDRPRSPKGSVRTAVTLVLDRWYTVAQAARSTGAFPESVEDAAWAAVKQLVRERDSYTCLNCGHAGTDVHHRVRRGMGGTADPVIAFGMANLVLLCRPCHRLAHKTDDPEMASRGYRLDTSQDPAAEPLMIHSEFGSGMTVRLTPGGAYSEASPMAGAV